MSEHNTPRGVRPGWAALLIAGITLLCLGLTPLRDPEVWWHLYMGDLIQTFSAVPAANHTMYITDARTTSLIQPWLGQRLARSVYDLTSIAGLLLARNLWIALAMALVCFTAARRGEDGVSRAPHALPASALGLAALYPTASAGPTVWVVIPAVLLMIALWRAADSTRWRNFAWVMAPASVVIWANVDSAVWFPLMWVAAFAIPAIRRAEGKERAGWALSLAACLIAPLLNPRGVALIPHLFETFGRYTNHPLRPAWASVLMWPAHAQVMGGLAMALSGVWLFRPGRGDLRSRLLWGGLALLALLQLKNLLWFGLALPLLLRAPRAEAALNSDPADAPRAKLVASAPLLAIAALLIGLLAQPLWSYHPQLMRDLWSNTVRDRQPHKGIVAASTPIDAVELLRPRGAIPRLLHAPRYAGFILTRLAEHKPAQIVAVDPRAEFVPDETYTTIRTTLAGDASWRNVVDMYSINAALLIPGEHDALIKKLRAARWYPAYTSTHAVLLLRPRRAGD